MEITDTLKKFTMMLSKKDTKEGMEHKENKECMSCNSKKEGFITLKKAIIIPRIMKFFFDRIVFSLTIRR